MQDIETYKHRGVKKLTDSKVFALGSPQELAVAQAIEDIVNRVSDAYECEIDALKAEIRFLKDGCVEFVPTPASSYNEFWDTGFAQAGDPYGIQSEYVAESANPNAAIPTQEQADAVVAQANAEREANNAVPS
jgi:hypothetical protein